MNKITVGTFTFTDSDFATNPELFLSESMLSDTLGIDTISFEVYSYADGNDRYIITAEDKIYATLSDEPYVVQEGDLLSLPYGQQLNVYKDSKLRAVLYLEKVERVSKIRYRISAFSAVGLLENMTDLGGMFNGVRLDTAIWNIVPAGMFTIDNALRDTYIYGWLPRASARDNLRNILFSVGASIVKRPNNAFPTIIYNTGDIEQVDLNTIYLEDYYPSNPEKVTRVVITEHSFIAADNPEEVLFENVGEASVTNEYIYFDQPYHSYRVDGLTLVDSDVNWAKVTGTGTLYAKPYTDTQRQLAQDINAGSNPNEVRVDKAYMVNPLNSNSTLNRLVNYYTNAQTVAFSAAAPVATRAGIKANYTDPNTGEYKTGIIQEDSIVLSATDKHKLSIVSNWTPKYFGNNYTHSAVITSNTYWDVPEGVTNVRLILIGAGDGGSSGANGWGITAITGGVGGEAGSAGKVLIVDTTVPSGATQLIVLPASGGAGGVQTAGSGNASVAGSAGGATAARWAGTATGYSSSTGSVPVAGMVDTLTGIVYATAGVAGIAGSDGASYNPSVPQTSVEYGGKIWYSGENAEGRSISTPSGEINPQGGLGGGAAVGSNGNDGGRPDTGYETTSDGQGHISRYQDGGDGGNGADATIDGVDQTTYGAGGNGGHGGGGGGAGGRGDQSGDYSQPASFIVGAIGLGGQGSNGGKGGDGCVIIYY